MCGIVGAIRARAPSLEGLIEGLRVLEYRGYDSAGVAVVEDERDRSSGARPGRLEELEALGGRR